MIKRIALGAALLGLLSACTVAKTAGSAAVTTGQVALGAADLVL